jgi:general secretion pathway protein L
MTTVVTRLPASEGDNPEIWRNFDGEWHACGPLADFTSHADDTTVMAVVSPGDTRCIWSSLPDLEPRQAEGVAKLNAAAQSLGPVHAVARHITDDVVVTATISPATLAYGITRLLERGLNPDIVIPAGLAIDANPDHLVKAQFDGLTVLRGATFAIPDEAVFRNLLLGDMVVEEIDTPMVQAMLLTASERPLLNLREGAFAKREQMIWLTAAQRKWLFRLLGTLVAATLLLGIVTIAKYWSATGAENDRALAAAQTIDPSIQDIDQAEAQLERALQQKGLAKGRFTPLAAGLWRAVKAAPNLSVRDLRYGADGILTVVLAAPNSDSINKALIAIQQDGYRVTATPRQDATGATLVDLTMRMP